MGGVTLTQDNYGVFYMAIHKTNLDFGSSYWSPSKPIGSALNILCCLGEINTVLMRHVVRQGLRGVHDTGLTMMRLNMGGQRYFYQICCTFQALGVMPLTCLLRLKFSCHPALICGIWEPAKNIAGLAYHTYRFFHVFIRPHIFKYPCKDIKWALELLLLGIWYQAIDLI